MGVDLVVTAIWEGRQACRRVIIGIWNESVALFCISGGAPGRPFAFWELWRGRYRLGHGQNRYQPSPVSSRTGLAAVSPRPSGQASLQVHR